MKVREVQEKIAGEIVLSDNPGKTMRKWREIFHVSLTEMAQAMNTTPSVISDYELGRRKTPGSTVIKKFVNALIEIDLRRGGKTISSFIKEDKDDAILDMRDFYYSVKASEIVEAVDGKNYTENINLDNINVMGYSVIESLVAILKYNSYDYFKIYGYNTQRALFFNGVRYGRSPMIAIRAHPLKPAMVVYIRPDRVDELAIKLAEIERVPLIETRLDVNKVISKLRAF